MTHASESWMNFIESKHLKQLGRFYIDKRGTFLKHQVHYMHMGSRHMQNFVSWEKKANIVYRVTPNGYIMHSKNKFRGVTNPSIVKSRRPTDSGRTGLKKPITFKLWLLIKMNFMTCMILYLENWSAEWNNYFHIKHNQRHVNLPNLWYQQLFGVKRAWGVK